MLRLNEAAKVLESVNFVSYCKGSLFFHLFSCDRERPWSGWTKKAFHPPSLCMTAGNSVNLVLEGEIRVLNLLQSLKLTLCDSKKHVWLEARTLTFINSRVFSSVFARSLLQDLQSSILKLAVACKKSCSSAMRGFAELEQLMFYWSTVFGAIRFAWKMRFAWEGLVNSGGKTWHGSELALSIYAWKTAQSSGLHWALARSPRKLHVMCFCKTARGWSLAISDSVHRGTKSIRISQKRKRCCSTFFIASFANPLLLAMLQCSQNSAQGSLESMDPMPVEGSPETLAECLSTECPVPVEAGLPARVPWPKVGWSRGSRVSLGHFCFKVVGFPAFIIFIVGVDIEAAVTTLTQNVLGSGVLALPYAMCSAGILGGGLVQHQQTKTSTGGFELGRVSILGFWASTDLTCWR